MRGRGLGRWGAGGPGGGGKYCPVGRERTPWRPHPSRIKVAPAGGRRAFGPGPRGAWRAEVRPSRARPSAVTLDGYTPAHLFAFTKIRSPMYTAGEVRLRKISGLSGLAIPIYIYFFYFVIITEIITLIAADQVLFFCLFFFFFV